KRHGALAVEAYRDMGLLPEALRNYLLRLGWSHGDEEIIPTAKAIEWFDLDHVGRSPSRFDMVKMTNLNAHYLREADDARLAAMVGERLRGQGMTVDAVAEDRLLRGMNGLKQRAKTLIDLAESASFYAKTRPLQFDDKAAKVLAGEGRARLAVVKAALTSAAASWSAGVLEGLVRDAASAGGTKLGDLAQPLRAALTGTTMSPPIFEVLEILGHDESIARIDDALR
ncbi:MAG: glutamate--tRNA ligase, partial [Alphaproteobacteria bacterium]|nr:glutamate--tRNA ligase [Alphaproteobacteria bacterium]